MVDNGEHVNFKLFESKTSNFEWLLQLDDDVQVSYSIVFD